MIEVARRRRASVDDPTMRWPSEDHGIAGDTTPYAMPVAAPYNAPVPIVATTVHGGDQQMHPSVLDFQVPWNGYRFWMAQTPLSNGIEDLENPCIMASHDGYTWVEPAGISNPLAPVPPTGYNSDTELAYEPETGRLICYYRPAGGSTSTIDARTSLDGVHWSPIVNVIPTVAIQSNLSPCVVRRKANDWWMFCWSDDSGFGKGLSVRRSATPLSGWSAPVLVPSSFNEWHIGVVWDGVAFRLLGMAWSCWSSRDGYNWTISRTNPVPPRAGKWDASRYRPIMTVMDDRRMRVWYSCQNNGTPLIWHTGYTIVPRSLWPDPPST